MLSLHVPSEFDDTELEERLQTMDVWVTYLNAVNAQEEMNLARWAAAVEALRRPIAVTGMEEDEVESIVTPTDSTWVRVFAPSLSTFARDVAGLKTHRVGLSDDGFHRPVPMT
jgi:hypothetical protein